MFHIHRLTAEPVLRKQLGMICLRCPKDIDLQKLGRLLKNALCCSCKFQERIGRWKWNSILLCYSVVFLVGQFILHREPFRLGLVHQIVLTGISLLVIYMLKYCFDMGNKMKIATSGLSGAAAADEVDCQSIYSLINHMQKWQQSIWCVILPVFPCIGFIKKNLRLGYVPNTVTGWFATCFGASTFYLALIAYIHLAISIICFWKISHNQGKCIPLACPRDLVRPPAWLELWSKYFQKAETAFFISGTLFTLEYVMLMPQGIITVEKGVVIVHSPDPMAFVLGWLTIVLLIIIAFPIISILIRHCFRKALSHMQMQIEPQFQGISTQQSNVELWAYGQMLSSFKCGSYIYDQKAIVPVFTTGISLILNLAKLCESVIIPLISKA